MKFSSKLQAARSKQEKIVAKQIIREVIFTKAYLLPIFVEIRSVIIISGPFQLSFVGRFLILFGNSFTVAQALGFINITVKYKCVYIKNTASVLLKLHKFASFVH